MQSFLQEWVGVPTVVVSSGGFAVGVVKISHPCVHAMVQALKVARCVPVLDGPEGGVAGGYSHPQAGRSRYR